MAELGDGMGLEGEECFGFTVDLDVWYSSLILLCSPSSSVSYSVI